MAGSFKQTAKRMMRRGTPLGLRKGFCVLMERQKWFDPPTRTWWTRELLRDFADRDRNGYHRFLWSNHLAYAQSYEVGNRFGKERMVGSRRLFFAELQEAMARSEVVPEEVRSVFEVGCSLGYQLRHLETGLLRQAEVLEGIDIDGRAVEEGNAHLARSGSKVRLFRRDMAELDEFLRGRTFDLILCTGVLMYLQEEDARQVARSILRHSRIAAFSGLAHPERDNAGLERSTVRERDGSFIHDIDGMVRMGGGEVLLRRWEGPREVDGQTIYFVFAAGRGER